MIVKYLLGVDIGTTNSKGVITDYDGNIRSSAILSHETDNPGPLMYEHDATAIWWRDFCRLCRCLIKDAGINSRDIAAVGCSGLGPAFVPVDELGHALRPAILYGIDTRAYREIKALSSLFGDQEVFNVGGQKLSSQSVGPKLLWFKENEPAIYDRTYKILSCNGFVVSKLTGMQTIDINNATFWGPFFNIHTQKWRTDLIERAGLNADIFPDISIPSDVAGTIIESASVETGLAIGTPVVVGSIDTFCEATGSGAIEDGDIFIAYGTTMTIVIFSALQKTHPDLWANFHTVPGLHTILGGMSTAGALTKWFIKNYMPEYLNSDQTTDPSVYPILQRMAAETPAGSNGLLILPYFSGERTPINDERARGIIAGLTLAHTRNHIYRALLEGTAYAVTHHIEIIEEMGIRPQKIIAAGGGAVNYAWTQIISDVTGLNQICIGNTSFAAPTGIAYIAGFGAGIFSDFERLKMSWVRRLSEVNANTSLFDIYKHYYVLYKNLYRSSIDQIHDLAEIGVKNS